MVHQGYSSQRSRVNQRLNAPDRLARQRDPSFSTRGLCRRRIRNRQTSHDPFNRRNTNGRVAQCLACEPDWDGCECPNQVLFARMRNCRSRLSVTRRSTISGKRLRFWQIGLRFGATVEYPLSWLICPLQEALSGADRPAFEFAGA